MSTPSHAPAGNRRFWVTVALFAIANVAFWFVFDRLIRPSTDLLRVESFSPANGATIGQRPTFTWRFNLDVSHHTDDPAPGSINPPMSGKWIWKDARTLAFSPDADLPKATRYSLTLSPEHLHTPQGFTLPRAFVSSAQTQPLALVSATQIGFEGENRAILELRFSDSVLPADVLKAIQILGPDRKPLRCSAYGEPAGEIIRVVTDSIEALRISQRDLALTVRLPAGLAGTSGPLGLSGAVEQSVPITTALVATKLFAQSYARGDTRLQLSFNNDVDVDKIKPLISIQPTVQFQVESGYHNVRLIGDFKPATRYALSIAKSPAGSDPGKFPRADVLSVFVPDAPPGVWFEHDEGYLGSRGNRTLMAHAINVSKLRVEVTRVYDNNLVAWRNADAKSRRFSTLSAEDFAKPIASKQIHLSGKKNQTQDVPISLNDLLPRDAQKDGAYRIQISSDDSDTPESDQQDDDLFLDSSSRCTSAMVTLSDLGICAKSGRDGVHAWVVSLSGAKPLANVRVRAFSDKNQLLGTATTDGNGLAHIGDLNPARGEQCAILIADRAENDLTWLDLRTGQLSFSDAETTGRAYLREGHEAFLFTERGVYRPGETVHLRAIVRGADLKTPAPFPVRWKILRPDLRDWNSSVTKLDENGEATWDLSLPEDLVTGRWTARIGLPGDDKFFGSVTFQVEEFVPDRLKVDLKIADESPRLRVGEVNAKILGNWLFGKPAAGLATHVVTRLDPAPFAPANFAGWTFGDAANTGEILGDEKPLGRRDEIDAGNLSDSGAAIASLDLEAMLNRAPDDDSGSSKKPKDSGERPYAGPWRLNVAATVLEPGGRGVTGSHETSVDRVDRYIGIERPQLPARPGASTRIPVVLVSPNGALFTQAAMLSAVVYRETWNNTLVYKDGRYHYDTARKLDPIGSPMKIAMTNGKCVAEVTPPTSGAYVLRVTDGEQGAVATIGFFAALGEWDDNISRENPEKLELSVLPASPIDLHQSFHPVRIANLPTLFEKQTPATQPATMSKGGAFPVDSIAQVMVASPFAGRLLLTLETDSVAYWQVIDMPTSHVLVPILIPRECRPNAYVSATVVRAVDPNATWRVHRAIGVAAIKIDNDDRKLNVAITAPAELRPAQTLDVGLHVLDSSGKPVRNASVDVSAVDEGICQLTNFKTPDPFGFFYAPRALGITSADLYSQLMPEVPRPDRKSTIGGDADAQDSRHHTPVSAKRVRPVALVSSVVHTDENGDARTSFSLPQFAGQLRVMAVAHARQKFGNTETHTLVRSPLLVQSSWPRFVAPGDAFAVTLTAFNNTPRRGQAKIRVDVLDHPAHLRFADSNRPHVELSPLTLGENGQATAMLNVVADRAVGVAHVRVAASMDSESFEETIEIPIRPASPTITTGGFAIATPGSPATLAIPANLVSGTGHFEVRVTPFPSLELPRGLDYLERYPYGCAEQTTSTLFPLVYLSDIGEQIAPGVFSKARVDQKVQSGVLRLLGMQTADGGIAMWPGGRSAWPWVSVYAAHFVIEAQNAGHPIPEDFRARLLSYVRNLLSHSTDHPDELETQAYACYVLALAGKPDRAAMDRIGELATKPDANFQQARFHLAAAWVAAGRRDRAANLIPTTLPPMRTHRQLGGNIGSAVRDRAILLSTLLRVDPDRADLPAIAQQLADAGKNGNWRSTQDTAFAVMALGQYLRQCKPAANYETAELVAGATRLATANAGQTLAWSAPTTQPSTDSPEVKITGERVAKAYISWLSTGVPTSQPSDVSNGLRITRRFLSEKGNPIDHNTVHSGELVQVELSLESASALENVVIEDLLPAGLEIENPRLETSAKDTTAPAKDQIPVFQVARSDMRDDRMIVMGDLSAGVGKYVYTCRAVTPGVFALPPARAECMYDLGTSSLAGAGTFTVIGGHEIPIANIGRE